MLTNKRLSDKIVFADAVKKQQSGSKENNRFYAERLGFRDENRLQEP